MIIRPHPGSRRRTLNLHISYIFTYINYTCPQIGSLYHSSPFSTMNGDIQDVDVISELVTLSKENKDKEIVDLLRENLYQFNKDPQKLIAVLTIRIYYNLHQKNFNEVELDFELVESIFRDKLNYAFPYTSGSNCPFSTFLIYAYYPHLKGSSFLAIDRLYGLLNKVQEELNAMKEGEDNYLKTVENIKKTVILTSEALFTVLRPLEALKLLTNINLKYDDKDPSTNLMLAIIYRKLGYLKESERCIQVFLNDETENGQVYEGILKVFEKDYEGAVDHFSQSEEVKNLKDSQKHLMDHEMVTVNNLAMVTLYAKRSQDAKKLFFQYIKDKEGLQAQRGISSNADVLKELSIYD